jgi:TusA-related sulfurtransferase
MTDLVENDMLRKIDNESYAIDVRGLACPYPQILVMGALEELGSGKILEVTLDNPPSARDVPRTLKEKGFEVKDITRVDTLTWKITVRNKR